MEEIKVIFLDIDGVLNWWGSTSRCGGFTGIDDQKLLLLKELSSSTNSRIVLISSWKTSYEQYLRGSNTFLGQYLYNKFKEAGLEIFDTTLECEGGSCSNRGWGIHNWINTQLLKQRKVVGFTILDDEIFDDYSTFNLITHLVKTVYHPKKKNEKGGLTKRGVELALDIINKGEF